MKNRFDEAIRFKNGNIHIKWSDEHIAEWKAGKFTIIELVSFTLDHVDTYFIGDEFCLGNYSMGCLLYNAYNDCIYILDFSDDLDRLIEGKTLILHALPVNSDARELIKEEGY